MAMIITVGPVLSTQTLDAALGASRLTDEKSGQFFAGCSALSVDLSRVCAVEYAAAAQVLLLAEAACRAKVAVRIQLPAAVRSGREQQALARPRAVPATLNKAVEVVANAVGRRRSALGFLRSIGFVAAARMPHLPDADVAIVGAQGSEPDTSGVVPFRWLEPTEHRALHQSHEVTESVRLLDNLGFPAHVGRVVVHELLENIALHAVDGTTRPPHALVGCIAIDPATFQWERLSEWFPDLARSAVSARSPVLKLIVGDSGFGLANRLAPHLPQTDWTNIPTDSGALSDSEAATIWALNRWSTSDPHRGASRNDGTGLWQVQRLIRRRGGGLLLRSADALTGLKLNEKSVDLLRVPGRTRTVGTLVDISVLPRGSRRLRPASEAGDTDEPRFAWLRVTPDEAATARLRNRVSAGDDDHAGLIITIDSHSANPMSDSWLAAVLTDAARVAAHSVVSVVAAGVPAEMLRRGVKLLHERLDAASPFLLIDQRGRSRWCGGPPRVRDLLNATEDDAEEPLAPRTTVSPALVEALGADSPLLAHTTDEIAVTATEVIDALRSLVADRLRTAVDQAGPGINRGLFRTPTLQVTDRWIDVDTLLRETVGTATAGFLLAQHVVRNDGPMVAGTQVLRVATASTELAQSVAQGAGIQANLELVIDEFDSSAEVFQRVKPGSSVVLCADLILTENSVKRALAETLNWGMTPVAIVTALDARKVGGLTEILNVRLPVWRLAKITITTPVDSGRKAEDVDPVLRSVGSVQEPLTADYDWDPDDFLTAATRVPGAMSLGHMGRPAHRHFTVAFDVRPLFADEWGMRERVVERMVAAAMEWWAAAEHGQQASQLVVCHPDRSDEPAGVLALLVADALRQRLSPEVSVDLRPVIRAVLGSRWAFSQAIEQFPENSAVIVVDWGSIGATTIAQMIRLTADAGADRILGLVLLSQLPVHDERTLTMLRSVEGRRCGRNDTVTAVDVPVRIRFVTALGSSATSVAKCSICRTIEQFQRDLDDGHLPRPVRAHIERLAGMMRLRSREEVVAEQVDVFGAPIDRRHVVAYVRLRNSLLSAMRFTAERQRVADDLADLAAGTDPIKRGAAIRLLAAEKDWLKLPPLRFAGCREDVASISLEVATKTAAHERLRLQAVTVLATAAPDTFVRQLHTLWESCLALPTLITHVMYQLSRIVGRRRGDVPVPPAVLRSQLVACRELLDDGRPVPADLRSELGWQLTRMGFQVAQGEQDGDISVRKAWRTLRERYLDKLRRHSDAEAAITRLLVQLDSLAHGSEVDDNFLTVAEESWNDVRSFLYNYVLPHLPPLGEMLSGPFVEEHLPVDVRRCLEALSARNPDSYLMKLDNQILALRDFGKPGAAVALSELNDAVWVLYKTVFSSAGGTDLARLAHLLDTCITDVLKTIKVCALEARRLPLRVRLVADGRDFKVFCPEALLSKTITHLLHNAGSAKHRPPGGEDKKVDLEIVVSKGDGFARVLVRNEGTVSTGPVGHGITAYQRKLLDFDADLNPVAPTGRWSYEIELRLALWAAEPWKE